MRPSPAAVEVDPLDAAAPIILTVPGVETRLTLDEAEQLRLRLHLAGVEVKGRRRNRVPMQARLPYPAD